MREPLGSLAHLVEPHGDQTVAEVRALLAHGQIRSGVLPQPATRLSEFIVQFGGSGRPAIRAAEPTDDDPA